MLYIFTATLTLGLLVLVHELGHYAMARFRSVPVEIFSIGFGKAIWKKKIAGTEFRIGWIPLGGYVAYLDDETVKISPKDRSLVALAGPIMNLLFAPIVLTAVYLIGTEVHTLTINNVAKSSPAMIAGVEVNDKIISIEGKTIKEWSDITKAVSNSKGEAIKISVVKEDLSTKELIVTPAQSDTGWRIGISPLTETQSYGLLDSAKLGIKKSLEVTYLTAEMIFNLFSGEISAGKLGGPIMISKIAGEQASAGLAPLLFFIALLSINFGLMNLLPLPVLDGGQIILFSIEALSGKALSEKSYMVLQRVGVSLLVSVFGFTLYNDITTIILGR